MKHTVSFSLTSTSKKDATTAPLRCRVNYNKKRVEVRLGVSVEIAHWDKAKGRISSGVRTTNNMAVYPINRMLADVEMAIEDLFARCELMNHRPPTEPELQDCIALASGKPKSKPEQDNAAEGSLYPLLMDFIASESRQKEWTRASVQKYQALGEHLKVYNKNLSLSDLDEYGIQDFVDSLHRESLRNTTIANQVTYLRAFLRWCAKRGYTTNKDFESYRPRLRGSDGSLKIVIYLEWEELMQLYNYDFPPNHRGLAAVRDVFCFQCFSGLRYSDVAKLKKTDINFTAGYFTTITQKTVDPLKIELNKYSRAILEKYKDVTFKRNLALPIISNVKMNAYLKTIGEMVGLNAPQRVAYFKGSNRYEEVYPKWQLLTTHCGRRTFVVNALALGIPAEVVMKWTGHKDFKAMRPYVQIVDKLKASEMEKFNK